MKNLKKLRKGKELSQAAVGEHLGVHKRTVGRWERGELFPREDKVLELIKLLGVTRSEIYGD